MKPLSELFCVSYGNKFDLNKMECVSRGEDGVNFVGRSSRNHGVSGFVRVLPDVEPYESGLITVALGGSKLLSSFVQDSPFYTAQNVAVLRPKTALTYQQKLYVCLLIRHNRWRYSAFGREANRTLKDLLIPTMSEFPDWIAAYDEATIDGMDSRDVEERIELHPDEWKWFRYEDIFILKKGRRLTKANMKPGDVLFIGASDRQNGVTAKIGQPPLHEGNVITVPYNGSVSEAFYQPYPFWASDDVNVLYPRDFEMTPQIGIFLCTIIRQEKYRFNYGRKWNLTRMKTSQIRLPATPDERPDWDLMEKYIRTLRYSSNIAV